MLTQVKKIPSSVRQKLVRILLEKDANEEPEYDLCVIHDDLSVDICRSGVNGTWTLLVDLERCKENVPTRKECIDFLQNPT